MKLSWAGDDGEWDAWVLDRAVLPGIAPLTGAFVFSSTMQLEDFSSSLMDAGRKLGFEDLFGGWSLRKLATQLHGACRVVI